jgi:hypothetical protein
VVWERSYEALRVTLVSNVEHILALPQKVFRLTMVNRRWRQQTYAGVTVLLVIPLKKNSDRKHDCLGYTQNGPGSPADISWFGIG